MIWYGVTRVEALIRLWLWPRPLDRTIVPSATFLSEEDGDAKWVEPVGEVIKVNVNAALFTETGTYSYACVARNNMEVVLEAITSCRVGSLNPEMAEAMGVREALSWIRRKSWHNVVVETDSLTVVQSVRSPVNMLSYFGSLISDCKDLLQDLLGISLYFVRRSANSVAHFLARASYYVADLS